MAELAHQLIAVVVGEQVVAGFQGSGQAAVTGVHRRRMAFHGVDATDRPLLAGDQRIEGVLAVQTRDQQGARVKALDAGQVDGDLGEVVIRFGESPAGQGGVVVHAAQVLTQATVQVEGQQRAAGQVGAVEGHAQAQLANLVLGDTHAQHVLLQIGAFHPGAVGDHAARGQNLILQQADADRGALAFHFQYLEVAADTDVTGGAIHLNTGAARVNRRRVIRVGEPGVAVAD